MKNTFKQELYYMFHSKLIVIFLSITTLLVFLGALQAINLQKFSVVQFEQTKSIYKNKTDFLKDLRKNYTESNITDEETNINTEINNSARYSYDYVQKSNYQLTSTNEILRFNISPISYGYFRNLTFYNRLQIWNL